MISYKEKYFKAFEKEKIFSSTSFDALLKRLDGFPFHGPYQEDEEVEFIKSAKNVLNIIGEIISRPQITVYDEDVIVRSEQVTNNIDINSFLATLSDSSLWKKKNKEMSPELVHTTQSSDSDILFENIFITKVLDFISDELKSISEVLHRNRSLESVFQTTEINFSKYGIIESLKDFDFPYSDVLTSETKSVAESSDLVKKLLKKCSILKFTPFYQRNSKAKVRRKEIIVTNILLNDRRYFTCYRFYKQYVSQTKDEVFSNLYIDYLMFRIINDLKDRFSFLPSTNRIKIEMTSQGLVFEKPIRFNRKYFTYSIEKSLKDNSIIVSVKTKNYTYRNRIPGKEVTDKEARYCILPYLEVSSENIKEIRKRMKQKRKDGFTSVSVITLANLTRDFNNILNVSFYQQDDIEDSLVRLFYSYSLVFEGDHRTYLNMCPICGSTHVRKTDSGFICGTCEGVYTDIVVANRKCFWIQDLGRKQ